MTMRTVVSGQVSRDLDGKTAYVGDVEGQLRQVWANLKKPLVSWYPKTRQLAKRESGS